MPIVKHSPPSSKQSALKQQLAVIRETYGVIGGKWKIKIITGLLQGRKNFNHLLSAIEGISPKMLALSLKELYLHGLITRTVITAKSIRVSYEVTDLGYTLQPLVHAIAEWGQENKQHKDMISAKIVKL